MAGLPTVIAITFSLRLIEMACQLSYPRNSENARPPGTFTAYLSWAANVSPPTQKEPTQPPQLCEYLYVSRKASWLQQYSVTAADSCRPAPPRCRQRTNRASSRRAPRYAFRARRALPPLGEVRSRHR